jgi:hypothetical protein
MTAPVRLVQREAERVADPPRALILARFASTCLTCGGRIRRGDRCAWSEARGAICETCHSRGRAPSWYRRTGLDFEALGVVVPMMPRKRRT